MWQLIIGGSVAVLGLSYAIGWKRAARWVGVAAAALYIHFTFNAEQDKIKGTKEKK
jgi:hypothetical protein